MKIDLSYLEASKVAPIQKEKIHLILVGCGGTGSWIAPHLARIAKILTKPERPIRLSFVDFDVIEPPNLERQNFCAAELGLNKAQTLAYRYGTAYGSKIAALPMPFQTKMVEGYSELTLIIGCVDNAKARIEINKTLESYQTKLVWWLDMGNAKESGQILIGNTSDLEMLKRAFQIEGLCTALPSPALQHPELLVPAREELEQLSCEEMALLNAQSLTVNQQMAAIGSNYIVEFLTGTLKKYASYLDLGPGLVRSKYVSSKEISLYCQVKKAGKLKKAG
jgi:PRTRC genetic system ThiF family protein